MNLPSTPSFSLKNKRALIVGASSGIGLACAVALAEYGASITIAARRSQKLEELSASLKDKGISTELVELDVSKTDRTLEIAKKYKTKILKIKKFLPGRAINLGINKSSGEIIVCLSAHCIPTDEDWLKNLRIFKN